MATFSGEALLAVRNASGLDHRLRTSVVAPASTAAAAHQAFELAAGASVTLQTLFNASSLAPNAAAILAWIGLFEDNSGVLVDEQQVMNRGGGWATGDFVCTAATFTALRPGTYRIRVRMEYAQATGDATNGKYAADSDGGYTRTGVPNTWNATLQAADRGYLRAGLSVSAVDLDNTTAFDGPPSPFTFPDPIRARVTSSHMALANSSTLVIDADTLNGATPARDTQINASSTSTAWADNGAVALVDSDPTSFGFQVGPPANSTLSGRPWTHFEAAPTGWTLGGTDGGTQTTKAVSLSKQAFLTWNPEFNCELLANRSGVTTDPNVLQYVISADQLFLRARILNARNEAQSGLTLTQQLLNGATVVRSDTSQVSGADGWAPVMVDFTPQLVAPSGNRTQRVSVQPAGWSVHIATPTQTLGFASAYTAHRAIALYVDPGAQSIRAQYRERFPDGTAAPISLDAAPTLRLYRIDAAGNELDVMVLTQMSPIPGSDSYTVPIPPGALNTPVVMELRGSFAGGGIEAAIPFA